MALGSPSATCSAVRMPQRAGASEGRREGGREGRGEGGGAVEAHVVEAHVRMHGGKPVQ